VSATWDEIVGPAGPLALHLAPVGAQAGGQSGAVVLCHGFPSGLASADRAGDGLAGLADRLAVESDRRVVASCLRGVGASAGDFSLDGWLEDLRAVVAHTADLAGGGGIWVVGFGAGGALGLCVGCEDERVRGVACFGAPASFGGWVHDAPGLVEVARQVGVIRTPGFPVDMAQWSAAFTALRPDQAAANLQSRPLLFVHGSDDEEVPVTDGRLLADAAGPSAELRVILGAGHRLLADPRAIALLAGWLERHRPARH
jgi:fermentation-respiration switch protein FrsA (DUF1100 family)